MISEDAAEALPLDDDLLLDEVVRALVSDPGSVKVGCEDSGRERTLILSVAPVDRGRVIGHAGKNIRMLEALMHVVGQGRGVKIRVRLDGQDAQPRRRQVEVTSGRAGRNRSGAHH